MGPESPNGPDTGSGQEDSSGTETQLGDYLANSRAAAQKVEQTDVTKRVEELFGELNLPFTRTGGDWDISADVGTVSAGLDEDEEVLTFSQFIHPLTKPDKKQGEYFGVLLRENISSVGACFAVFDSDSGDPSQVVILARIGAKSLDPNEITVTLESLFRLSALFDG